MKGLRLEQLIEKTGLKKPTIYAYIKKGVLPKPVKFGRASVWIEAEVELALKKKMSERSK
jgi:prophage regulatory protein